MAYDEGVAELLRGDIPEGGHVEEKKMFGGLCFMFEGHMLCGVIGDEAMFRVGKERQAAAREIEGTGPMEFTGRAMGGMVQADADAVADDARRRELMTLAVENVRSLPPRK